MVRSFAWRGLAALGCVVMLQACAAGDSVEGGGAPDAQAPDAQAPDASDDDGPGFALDLPEATIDPVDVTPTRDASEVFDAAPPDTGTWSELDALVTSDAPVTPDAPTMPDAGCAAGSETCGGVCVDHGAAPNVCGTAIDLGRYCGDVACNSPLCRANSYRTVAMRTGTASRWLRVGAVECSICSADIAARVTLAVPPGIDYDLLVHAPCGAVIQQSSRGAGVTEQVEVIRSDRGGPDDSFEYFIEVRYRSGAACDGWTLTVEARGPNATDC